MMIDRASWRDDSAPRFDQPTNRQARVSSALGYVFFFIPLVMHPESKFARYHANQGLMLTIWMLFGTSVLAAVPYAGPFLVLAAAAFAAVFAVRGMVLALRCQAKHIPLLGKLVILEYEERYSMEM